MAAAKTARTLVKPAIKMVDGWQRSLAYITALKARDGSGRHTGEDWRHEARRLIAAFDEDRPKIAELLDQLPAELAGTAATTNLESATRLVASRIESLRSSLQQ